MSLMKESVSFKEDPGHQQVKFSLGSTGGSHRKCLLLSPDGWFISSDSLVWSLLLDRVRLTQFFERRASSLLHGGSFQKRALCAVSLDMSERSSLYEFSCGVLPWIQCLIWRG
ncbi:hypothetical protein AVEN_1380-1 [Araneus ventricosus]|uniref:Uncharacterized protein n=1 Tax=Araneus ventricosus TaxID=182803 RepID=A0A4Y2LXH4_ARAVE|nr:hypothetical protein AVEN_1380-1 [Araneus ventricosus]